MADSLLDSVLDPLNAEGFGIIQLPPAGLDPATTGAWLEQVTEHVAEFASNDYEVVLVNDGLYAVQLEQLRLPQYVIRLPSTSTLTPDS